MTPESKEELRSEIIQKARLLYGGGWFARSVANTDTLPNLDTKGNTIDEVADGLMQLFTSQLEQAVREARIDELDNLNVDEPCVPDCTPARHAYHEGRYDAQQIIDRRLQRLQSTKEDKSNE